MSLNINIFRYSRYLSFLGYHTDPSSYWSLHLIPLCPKSPALVLPLSPAVPATTIPRGYIYAVIYIQNVFLRLTQRLRIQYMAGGEMVKSWKSGIYLEKEFDGGMFSEGILWLYAPPISVYLCFPPWGQELLQPLTPALVVSGLKATGPPSKNVNSQYVIWTTRCKLILF